MSDPLLIAVDVETTGFHAVSDRIVEIGAVKFRADGTVLGSFESLANPGRPCHPRAFAAHGIPDATLADAPSQPRVLAEFADWLGRDRSTVLVGHNFRFDNGFLLAGFGREGVPIPPCFFNPADTLPLARAAWPGLASYQLGDLAALMGHGLDRPHRAPADAERTMRLWLDLHAGRRPTVTALLTQQVAKAAAKKSASA